MAGILTSTAQLNLNIIEASGEQEGVDGVVISENNTTAVVALLESGEDVRTVISNSSKAIYDT